MAPRLAATISPLTRLHYLGCLPNCSILGAPEEDMERLTQAVAALPRLSSFQLSSLPLGVAAAAGLASSTSLTSLSLSLCKMDDDGVATVCAGLAPTLLNLGGVSLATVTDGALLQLTEALPRLRVMGRACAANLSCCWLRLALASGPCPQHDYARHSVQRVALV